MEYDFALSYSVSVKPLSILLRKTTCFGNQAAGGTVRRGGVGAGLDIPRSLVSNETAVSQPELKLLYFFVFSSGWALTTKICNDHNHSTAV